MNTEALAPPPLRRRPQSVLRERTPLLSRLDEIRASSTWADIFEGQPQHLGIAILMVAGAFAMFSTGPGAPRLVGLSAAGWGQISVMLAVLHQVLVALVFRLQLHRNLLGKTFGESDMRVWAWLFVPLLVLRPITLILTGWADVHVLTGIRYADWAIGGALLAASGWTLWAVFTKFTFPRALGGDHFRNQLAGMELVREGPFRLTPNAMYAIGFLGLWGIAFLFGSWNALVVALFQHAYIWVHMYCTEAPDMEWIYGDRLARAEPRALKPLPPEEAEKGETPADAAADAGADGRDAKTEKDPLRSLRPAGLRVAEREPTVPVEKRNLRRESEPEKAPDPEPDARPEIGSVRRSKKKPRPGSEPETGSTPGSEPALDRRQELERRLVRVQGRKTDPEG